MSMEHWTSLMSKARERPASKDAGAKLPIQGVISSVHTETERVLIPDYGGGEPTRVTHPYVSIRSWRRVMPEPETAVVVHRRGDSAQSETSYYWSGHPEKRIAKYKEGVGYYRNLDQGELEDSSYGLAQIYMSRHGALDMRGGIVKQWLNNNNMEIGSKASVSVRRLHDHISTSMRGEERYGIVYRYQGDLTNRKYIKMGGAFAKEYMRSISFAGQPGILVDTRMGHVVEDNGSSFPAPSGRLMRRRDIYYSSDGSASYDIIDEDGNKWNVLSDSATFGWNVNIPSGSYYIKTGDNITFTSRRDIRATADNLIFRVRSAIHVEADVVVKIISSGEIIMEAPTVQINGRLVSNNRSPI